MASLANNSAVLAFLISLAIAGSSAQAEMNVQQLDVGIYYGAAPTSASDYARLRSLGIEHVIDMRTFKRIAGGIESHQAQRWGMAYQRIPIGFFPTRRGTTPQIMDLLVRRPCGAIYFHCNLGSDRTGLVVALYRVHQMGWQPCKAFRLWKRNQFNTNLKDLDRYFWQSVGGSCS